MKFLFRAFAGRGRWVVGLACAVLAAQTVRTGNDLERRVRRVGEQLKCFCGEGGRTCSYTVGSCNMLNCHFREEVNAQIRPMVKEGVDDATILTRLKEKYGDMVLAAPPAEGFNLLGWLMPFAALVVGLLAVRSIVLRWRRPKPAAAAATGVPMDKFREQIEKELADLE
jgi:cytochrome c-type biogenesis protein CcmH